MSRSKTKITLAGGSVLALILMLVAACGGGATTTPAATTAPAKTDTKAAATTAPATKTAPSPAAPSAASPAAQTAASPAAKTAASPAAKTTMQGGITPQERQAAMQEGEVTYHTSRATATAEKIGEEATKALGIKVNIVRLSSSLNYNRTVQEFEQNVNKADVIDTSVIAHFIDMKEKGMLQPYIPASINLYRSPEYYDPEHYWHASQIGLGAINYNSDLVTGDMIPQTWSELTDPKYKDKLIQGHIKASGTSAIVDYHLVEMYGWEYFEQLQANNILTQQSCDATNILANGERLVALCDHQITTPAQAQGLPIETVFPTDGVFGQIGPVALLAKAPHPNAGKMLIDWITSPEGQQHYVDGGVLSPIDSPEIKYPPQYPDPKQMNVLIADPKQVEAWLPEAQEKFSEIFGG